MLNFLACGAKPVSLGPLGDRMRWCFALLLLLLLGCQRQAVPQAPPSGPSKRAGYEAIARHIQGCGPEPRIVLTAEASESAQGSPALVFRLTNVSQETLVTYPHFLPWGNPNSIQVAASTVSGETAPTFWPIADPGPANRISIAPGDSLVGQAPLTDRINDLPQLQKRGDVLVSWSYRSPFVAAPACRCVSGIALLAGRPN